MKLRPSAVTLVALAMLFIGQALFYLPQLPERMSSHYGADGIADGWMSKGSFFKLVFSFALGGTALFLGLAMLLPRVKNSLINLPNRQYWLADERREQTMRFLTDWLLWLGSLNFAFVLFVLSFVYQANLSATHRLDAAMGWVAGGFIIAELGLIVWLYGRMMRRVDNSATDNKNP